MPDASWYPMNTALRKFNTVVASSLLVLAISPTSSRAADHTAQAVTPVYVPPPTNSSNSHQATAVNPLETQARADAQAAADADAALAKAKEGDDRATTALEAAAAGTALTGGALTPALAAAQAAKAAADLMLIKARIDAETAHATADKSAAAAAASTPANPASSNQNSGVHYVPPSGTSGTHYVPPPSGTTGSQYIPPPSGATGAHYVPPSSGASGTQYIPPPSGTSGAHPLPDPGYVTPTNGSTGSGVSHRTPAPSGNQTPNTPNAGDGPGGASTPQPDPAGAADRSQPPVNPSSGYAADPGSAEAAAGHGSRAISDFPNLPELARISYQSSLRESAESLSTDYTSKLSPNEVASKFEEQLKNADWTEIDRSESGDAASCTQFVRRQWKRLSETADIRITQTKANGSEIFLAISLSRTGVLAAAAADLESINTDVAPTTGSPNDQGSRDPSNFPRIAGSVRKSFTTSGSATSSHEDAVYRAKVSLQQAEAFYVNHLLQADWEETERRETGDTEDTSHQVTLLMKLGGRSVTIHLKEIQPKLTEITVQSAM